MPMQPPPRLVRAIVFAVVCVSLTLTAHTMASRAPVPLWAVGAGGVTVLGLAAALAGHERSLATIFGGLLCGQFGLHVLFAAVQQTAVTHLEHGAQPAMTPTPAAAQTGSGMILAHLAAAGVSAWWLRRGERVAWSLTRQIATLAGWPIRALRALLGEVPILGPARIQPHVVCPARPSCAVLRYAVALRGPPSRSQVFSGALSA